MGGRKGPDITAERPRAPLWPRGQGHQSGPRAWVTPTCKSGDQAKPGVGGVVLGGVRSGRASGERWQLLPNLHLLSSLSPSPAGHPPTALWRTGLGTGPQFPHLGSGGREKAQVQASLLVTDDLTPALHLHSLHSHLLGVLEPVLP